MANDQDSNTPENAITETEVSIDALKSSLKSDATHPIDTTNAETKKPKPVKAKEVGGRGGLDPTRYGDWEKGGRCIDF